MQVAGHAAGGAHHDIARGSGPVDRADHRALGEDGRLVARVEALHLGVPLAVQPGGRPRAPRRAPTSRPAAPASRSIVARASPTRARPACFWASIGGDVHVHERHVRIAEGRAAGGREVREAGADPQHQVGLGARPGWPRTSRWRPSRPATAGGRTGARPCRPASRRRGSRPLSANDRSAVGGLGVANAAARDDQRPLRGPDQAGRAPQERLVGERARDHPAPLGEELLGELPRLGLHVLRKGDAGRPGLGRIGEDAHRAEERRGKLLGPPDPIPEPAHRPEGVVHRRLGRARDARAAGAPPPAGGWRRRRPAGAAPAAGSPSRAPRPSPCWSLRARSTTCTPRSQGGSTPSRSRRRRAPSPARSGPARSAAGPRPARSAWPSPATFPWPKMPSTPAKNGRSSPSRTERCAARKRTTACPTVSRTVPLTTACPAAVTIGTRGSPVSPAQAPRIQAWAGSSLIAIERTSPGPARTFRYQRAWSGDAMHGPWKPRGTRNASPSRDRHGHVPPLDEVVRAVGRQPVRALDAEVVDLLQLGLDPVRRVVVLVRRVARPVARRRQHLAARAAGRGCRPRASGSS